MTTIELLKNHPDSIPRLVDIWHEGIAKIWLPDTCANRVQQQLYEHLNDSTLPLTFVAFDGINPIGMCSLRVNDGIRADLGPWLGSLVVEPDYQKQGIGKLLIDVTKSKAKQLGFTRLYLFAFDPTIPRYYEHLGWSKMGIEKFKNYPVVMMSVAL